MSYDADMSLRPIDVGFDLRLHHDMRIEIPADTRSVAYLDAHDVEQTVTGTRAEIVAALIAAGYPPIRD